MTGRRNWKAAKEGRHESCKLEQGERDGRERERERGEEWRIRLAVGVRVRACVKVRALKTCR